MGITPLFSKRHPSAACYPQRQPLPADFIFPSHELQMKCFASRKHPPAGPDCLPGGHLLCSYLAIGGEGVAIRKNIAGVNMRVGHTGIYGDATNDRRSAAVHLVVPIVK
jgi:hypothetical protein